MTMEIAIVDAVWDGTPFQGRLGLEKAKEIGFDAIDVAFDPVGRPAEEVEGLLDDVRSVGLPVRSAICVSLGIGGDYNVSVQRFHVDRAKAHLDLASVLGAGNLLFVIGEYIWQNEIIPASDQWSTAVRNVREIAEYAEKVDIEIALEMEHWRFAFLNSIPRLIDFMDEVGVPACKANLDLNHLWAMNVDPDEIATLAGRISHAHISDCHGEVYENLPPGRGTAPLREYLAALVDTGFDRTLSLELGPASNGEDDVAWVEEGYRQTLALMNETGARAFAAPA
jgi:D-psicose/D-tagatose/L-ribulose 3-epimerase